MFYHFAKRCWSLLPRRIRTIINDNKATGATKHAILDSFFPLQRHNDIYSNEYVKQLDNASLPSSRIIAKSIIENFKPQSVADVGCGTGALLFSLTELGVNRTFGLEYSDWGLKWCKNRSLNVKQFDLRKEKMVKYDRFDLVCSLEVGEHLPDTLADVYVNAIVALGDIVLFSAAIPGQGGTNHINEQPNSYWITKFAAAGFIHDATLSMLLRSEWSKTDIAWYYAKNVMVFRKK